MPRPATGTPKPARRSSTSPTGRSSGCWSRTSPSICATASCSATSGCSTSGPVCSSGPRNGSRRPGGGSRVAPAGSCRSPSGRWPPSCTRSKPSTTAAGGGAVRARGQRGAAERRGATLERQRARSAIGARVLPAARTSARCSFTGQRPAAHGGGGDGPPCRRPAGTETTSEELDDVARLAVTAQSRRARRCGYEVPRPTVGPPSGRFPRSRTRWRPLWPAAGTPAGRGCSEQQRAYLDVFWERADVELDGDASSSRRSASRCSTPSRPGRAASSGRSPPRD